MPPYVDDTAPTPSPAESDLPCDVRRTKVVLENVTLSLGLLLDELQGVHTSAAAHDLAQIHAPPAISLLQGLLSSQSPVATVVKCPRSVTFDPALSDSSLQFSKRSCNEPTNTQKEGTVSAWYDNARKSGFGFISTPTKQHTYYIGSRELGHSVRDVRGFGGLF